NCAAGQTGITINNAGVAVDTIVTGDGKFVGSSVLAALLGTIKHATIRNVQFAGSNHLVTLGGTIGVLDIESLSGTFAAGSHVVGLDKATSVIGTLNAVNCDYTAADTSSGILVSKTQPAATISAINVLGGRFTSIGRLLDTAIGSTGTIYMNVTGVHMSGCNRIAQVAGVTLDAFLNGVYLASMINETIRVHVSGALTVRGSGVRGKSGSGVVRGASEVIQIFAPDFPADLSILTKANGAAATNTNAGLSCGLGPAISDGSTWKNLYSGTTY
ncbi:MAG: hypothetical protein VB093_11080, partial [Propionicimonas sp.]|nr:hypothetical protein [Propionicimonas sp.]